MKQQMRNNLVLIFFISLSFSVAGNLMAQPKSKDLKTLQQDNERMYRDLNGMGDRGESYQFTNVAQWKIVDDTLRNEIIRIYTDLYGENGTIGHQLKEFNPDDIYVFSVPTTDASGAPKYEPFHILFRGKRVRAADTSMTRTARWATS